MESARRGPGGAGTGGSAADQAVPSPVHALFQQRVDGDDALLKLAGLRFAQMGVAAEVYAATPDHLAYVLQFVPSHARLPIVHLSRGINVLHGRDRGWFIEVAERLQAAERVSCCIDVGHIGLRQATAWFERRHPGLDLKKLSPVDDRLPGLVADVQDAVASALPHVLDVTQSLGRLGKHVHFHLHDGHPLIPGLRDHFSFLTRLPVPFSYGGRRSLGTMYGPGGLASIVSAALDACAPQAVSFTIEVHQVEGRLPLADAAWLFPHWQDTTNAERMNHWLSVLSENAMLISG